MGPQHARRFFLAAAMAALPVLAGVIAVNLLIDAKGVYFTERRGSDVRLYVERLQASRTGLPAHPLERAVKLALAKTAPADCHVTGSSHEAQMSLATMPWLARECRQLINLAVSGGGIEDALTQLAAIAERRAKTVFIGVPPWFFNYGTDSRWSLLEADYHRARTFFGLAEQPATPPLAKLANLVNADYFRVNLKYLRAGRPLAEGNYRDAPALPSPDVNLFRPDGSLEYSLADRAYARDHMQSGCGDYKVKPPFLQQKAADDFAVALRRLEAMDIRPVLVLAPYHPLVWGCPGDTPKALLTVEAFTRKLAGDNGWTVIGSYDAKALGLTGADFDDVMHMAKESLRHLERTPRP